MASRINKRGSRKLQVSDGQDTQGESMRIDIRHASHAKLYGKIGKQLLMKHLTGPADSRLPTQVTRNAICRGFGYSSFNQIEYIAKNPNRALPPEPSDQQMLKAFTHGFGLALEVARDHGFTSESSLEVLAPQLALEAVDIIRVRRTQRTVKREFQNQLLPGEVPADDDIAKRAATLRRQFAPRANEIR
jgi:hypothetical protein